jgi:hypothetical protein
MFRLIFHKEDYIYTAENLQRIDSITKLVHIKFTDYS